MELAKAYNPQEAQAKWLAFWNEHGYFHATPDSRKPFTIVIPPPNVTGALHMGHALNNTLQDVLIRWRRMQGYNALWMPGTDHAGIATQAVVERLILQTEKKTRHEIGREELVKRIWEWKDKYEARILGQLKQLGCSCDWARTRFTLDPICVRAVRETFFNMFKDGLIFRGKRLVNWDTQLQTSVADDETYTEDTKGGFWTFKYPVTAACGLTSAAHDPDAKPQAAEFIRFSTTRPETMLGDTAVCVHPSDERYKHLIGKHVHIPLVNRDIPIIADALLADPTLGTGCVKVTPAHDPNDYACYTRNPHIGLINILNPDGTINENGGKYKGLDRYKAREAVIADMEALGLFEGKEERVIPLKYSDRSKSPIEPYLSDQWFVKMGDFSPLPPGEGPGVRGSTESKEGKLHHLPMPSELLEFVRTLRAEQTDAEKLLWSMLRDRRLAGHKFRRQHPQDPYVLDFYCHELQLAIELDGGQHNTPERKVRDEQRSAFLAQKGIRVIRFWNHEVLQDSEAVLEAIWRELPSAHVASPTLPEGPYPSPSPPAPLPGGEGRKGLARMAMEAVENGHVRFFPERYKNSYLDWLAEKRDWCISRQLWWGHRIPVWRAWTDRANAGEMAQKITAYMTAAGVPADEWAVHINESAFVVNCCPESELAEKALQAYEAFAKSYIWQKVGPDGKIGSALIEVPGFANATHAANELFMCSASFEQDPDVLDTWFSSMLWPHSTLGWPEKTPELAYYYPTSVLVTSRDIITLWVARMVIAGLYNLQQAPFHQVYITVKLMDGFGETMSKSRGNGVDPLDIIERYGADALRFLIMQISTETQDARMPVANVCPHCDSLVPVKQEHMYMRTKKLACPNCKQPFRPGGPWPADDPELKTAKQASERFEIGRNFANKIWNAARFILMNLDGYTPQALKREELPLEDCWILSRLASATKDTTEQLEAFKFAEAARTLYDFVWSEFCDWYLEMAKGRLKDGRPHAPREESVTRSVTPTIATVQRVLIGVLDAILRLVQPIMPFLAESLWSALNEVAFERGIPSPEPATESVMIAAWPEFPLEWRDAGMETSIAQMQELVRSVREVRNRYNIEPKTPLDAFVRCGEAVASNFQTLAPFIQQLAGVGNLHCGPAVTKPSQAASHVTPDFEAYVSLKGLIDPGAETKRLDKQLGDKRKQLQGSTAKLENANFVKNAPPEVVEQQREAIADLQKQIATIEQNIKDLQQ